MDTELAKSVLPLIGGALALAGGVFTFVSGRLKDAKYESEREWVITRTLLWLAFVLNIGGLFVALLFAYQIALVLFVFAVAIHVVVFLRRRGNASRAEIVALVTICSVLTLGLASGIAFFFTNRLLELFSKTH